MSRGSEPEELIAQLQVSKWFRDLDAEVWGDLGKELKRVELAAGEALFKQGEGGNAMFVVVSGRLKALARDEEGLDSALAEMGPGASVGEIQVLTGGARTASVYAVDEATLVRIPNYVFEQLARRSPAMLKEMVDTNRRRLDRSLLATVLPGLLGTRDEAALRFVEARGRWVHLERGETLFRQGEAGDLLYVLLRGRLASVVALDSGREGLVGEINRGDWFGETALVAGKSRSTGVKALRESRVIGFTKSAFDEIAARYPHAWESVTGVLVERMSVAAPTRTVAQRVSAARTIALVAAGEGVPLRELARELTTELAAVGPTLHLTRAKVNKLLGVHTDSEQADDDPAQLRLAAWLGDQEIRHRFVLYEAGSRARAWQHTCLRQADQTLLVANAGMELDLDSLRDLLHGQGGEDFRGRTALLILHPDDGSEPAGTSTLLAALGLLRHQHLIPSRPGAVRRLARFFAGRAIGLALGGGGARGFAEIGVVRALQEAGVEIDMAGGTSLGALIAAMVAMGWDHQKLLEVSLWMSRQRPERDYTLPVFGLISGERGERIIEEAFGGREIEDLWLNFFAIAANLTTAEQVILYRGKISSALRASWSLPGAVVPAAAGSDLLIDGGVLNNVPADIMKRWCDGRVIAVDVSPTRELDVAATGGELPSVWKLLWHRVNPMLERLRAPSLFEILSRAATLASVRNEELAERSAELFLRPPLDRFGMFDTQRLEEIAEIGYRYAQPIVEKWLESE